MKRAAPPPPSDATAVFPVVVVGLSSVYDLAVWHRWSIFSSLDAAVLGAKKLLFLQVHELFRGDAIQCEFDFAKLHTYKVAYYRKMWAEGGESDSRQQDAQPGPVFALVLRCERRADAPLELVQTFPPDLFRTAKSRSLLRLLPFQPAGGQAPAAARTAEKKTKRRTEAVATAAEAEEERRVFLNVAGVFQPLEDEVKLHLSVGLCAAEADAKRQLEDMLHADVMGAWRGELPETEPEVHFERASVALYTEQSTYAQLWSAADACSACAMWDGPAWARTYSFGLAPAADGTLPDKRLVYLLPPVTAAARAKREAEERKADAQLAAFDPRTFVHTSDDEESEAEEGEGAEEEEALERRDPNYVDEDAPAAARARSSKLL